MRTILKRRSAFPALASGVAIALSLAVGTVVAADDQTTAEPAPPASGADPAGVLKPKAYPETPAEVAECMKSWDPQTGMSKEEYEQSCKRTLKYFPEKPE